MTDDRLNRIREIAVQAMEVPERERSDWIEEACADDAELRVEVELVVSRIEEGATRLRPPPGTPDADGDLDDDVTRLLAAAASGDAGATDRFWTLVYEDLRTTARQLLSREYRDDLPGTTSLVHRAYVRLAGGRSLPAKNRAYFFGAAKLAMRRIIIERIRKKEPVADDELIVRVTKAFGIDRAEVLSIEDALEKLERIRPRVAEVVRYRMLNGFTVVETAEALDVSARTVKSDWEFARAWLHRELAQGDSRVGGR